ncbi:PCYCGC motif-containing (lipo)protein [Paenibacillus thalictri]|uniref:Lipoprotein n=1 Tax=Paenibacillus thalictri TaxID=2527873 RepID=A0A4Q9DGU1_9BACL|nr:PCYCGC motif-containing (lipo)protein [Paenibacillus thalictri]TBL68551.1 hypothetical protein EYB31_37760 [Paenibacillus thalictri]
MKKRLALFTSILFLSAALSACGKPDSTAGVQHVHRTPGGDLQEKTVSLQAMPDFLKNQKDEIRLVYQLAAQNTDMLKWMPCYCGCGESAGHQSNQNCFIKEVLPDGSVVWDDHGTRCVTCMEIAVTAAKLKQDGKSAKEIRQFIDATYQKGYAKPTNTPMPV